SFGAGDVHATGKVGISADDQTDINEITAVIAASGVAGIGAAAGVDVMNKDTEAFIGSHAKVTGDGLGSGATVNTGAIHIDTVAAASTFDPHDPKGQGIETGDKDTQTNAESDDPTARSTLRSGGTVGTPGHDSVLGGSQTAGDTESQSDDSLSKVRTTRAETTPGFLGVAVGATDKESIRTFTFSLGVGEVGVGVSAGVEADNVKTKAYIGDHATVNTAQGSVLVGAADDFYPLALAGGAAGGLVGVAPAVGVNVIGNETDAFIGDHATVNAGDPTKP